MTFRLYATSSRIWHFLFTFCAHFVHNYPGSNTVTATNENTCSIASLASCPPSGTTPNPAQTSQRLPPTPSQTTSTPCWPPLSWTLPMVGIVGPPLSWTLPMVGIVGPAIKRFIGANATFLCSFDCRPPVTFSVRSVFSSACTIAQHR